MTPHSAPPTDTTPVLSLWQPWAQLIVAGRKTIETRSWSTKHRGPLAIHAAKKKADFTDPVYKHCARNGMLDDNIRPLTFGAVVAVCELVDVLPIHEWLCDCDHGEGMYALVAPTHFGTEPIVGIFEAPSGNGVQHPDWSPSRLDCLNEAHPRQQAPWGDYRCGRFAWLLEDVRPLAEPIPFRGGQALSRRVNLADARYGRLVRESAVSA